MTFQKGNQYAKGNKPNKTSWKKGDIRLLKNKFSEGNLPNKTSFKKGEHRSPETEFRKGIIPQNKGKKRPLPICSKCGKKLSDYRSKICRKCFPKGEKHWGWKGGLTPENKRIRLSIEFRLWREAVFARDNWTCQKTDIKGGNLHPHHIQNFSEYPELRFAIDNGITLSEKAHKEFHKKYGQKNNTKAQLQDYLNQNEK